MGWESGQEGSGVGVRSRELGIKAGGRQGVHRGGGPGARLGIGVEGREPSREGTEMGVGSHTGEGIGVGVGSLGSIWRSGTGSLLSSSSPSLPGLLVVFSFLLEISGMESCQEITPV